MKMRKSALVLFASLLLGMIASMGVSAASDEGYFSYSACTGGVVVTKYTGGEDSVVIPDKLGKKKVVAIGSDIIRNKGVVSQIVLPQYVTTIDEDAFADCVALSSITLNSGITSIGASAFSGCTALQSITLPSTVKTIGADAFSGCSALSSVTLSENLLTIGSDAFADCAALGTIVFPAKLRTIGSYAFYNSGLDGILLIPGSVKTVGASAFESCMNLDGVVIGNGTGKIGAYAFSDCPQMATIQFPNSVYSIGSSALDNAYGDLKVSVYRNSYAESYVKMNYIGKLQYNIVFLDNVYATNITVNKESLSLYAGKSATLTAALTPEGYTNSLTWESFDSSIATVDRYGKVTGKKKGTVTIRVTAQCFDGGAPIHKNITVKVLAAPKTVALKTTSKTPSVLYIGNTMTLTPSITPLSAQNAPGLTVKSSNPKIATVKQTDNGWVVTPVGFNAQKKPITGKVTITATTYNGVTGKKTIEVKYRTRSKNWSSLKTSVALGSKYTLEGASSGLTFVSSDPGIISVTAKGVITAKDMGTAVVTILKKNVEQRQIVFTITKPNVPSSAIYSYYATKDKIVLRYRKATGVTGYQLQWRVKGGKWETGNLTKRLQAQLTRKTYKNLSANTTYQFRIRAYKTYNSKSYYGSWSYPVSITTKNN